MSAILLPIKPQFVEKIFSGQKRYEFRRTNFKRPFDKVVIYETAPTKMIVGEFCVRTVHHGTLKNILQLTKGFRGCSRRHLLEYFKNCKIAHAIEISSFVIYEKSLSLSELGISFTPQSVVYLD